MTMMNHDPNHEQQRAEIALLLQELRYIADARPSTWEPDVRDSFQQWAQSRARDAIAKADARDMEAQRKSVL